MIARLLLFVPGFAFSEYLISKIKGDTIMKPIAFGISIVVWEYMIGVRYSFIEMVIYYVICKSLLLWLYNKYIKGGKNIG